MTITIDDVRKYKTVCGDFNKEYRKLGNALNAYFKHYDKARVCYVKDTFFDVFILENEKYRAVMLYRVGAVMDLKRKLRDQHRKFDIVKVW